MKDQGPFFSLPELQLFSLVLIPSVCWLQFATHLGTMEEHVTCCWKGGCHATNQTKCCCSKYCSTTFYASYTRTYLLLFLFLSNSLFNQSSFFYCFHLIEKNVLTMYSHFNLFDWRSNLKHHHRKKKKFSLPILHNCKLHTLMLRICSWKMTLITCIKRDEFWHSLTNSVT
jgi:hypothetical protein